MSNALFMFALWINGAALGFAVAAGWLAGAWFGLPIVAVGLMALIPGVLKRLHEEPVP